MHTTTNTVSYSVICAHGLFSKHCTISYVFCCASVSTVSTALPFVGWVFAIPVLDHAALAFARYFISQCARIILACYDLPLFDFIIQFCTASSVILRDCLVRIYSMHSDVWGQQLSIFHALRTASGILDVMRAQCYIG